MLSTIVNQYLHIFFTVMNQINEKTLHLYTKPNLTFFS